MGPGAYTVVSKHGATVSGVNVTKWDSNIGLYALCALTLTLTGLRALLKRIEENLSFETSQMMKRNSLFISYKSGRLDARFFILILTSRGYSPAGPVPNSRLLGLGPLDGLHLLQDPLLARSILVGGRDGQRRVVPRSDRNCRFQWVRRHHRSSVCVSVWWNI